VPAYNRWFPTSYESLTAYVQRETPVDSLGRWVETPPLAERSFGPARLLRVASKLLAAAALSAVVVVVSLSFLRVVASTVLSTRQVQQRMEIMNQSRIDAQKSAAEAMSAK
jgi:hypothetical protein